MPSARPSARISGGRPDGTVVVRRMPSRWSFSPIGKQRVSPSSPRATIAETSQLEIDQRLEDALAPAEPLPGRGQLVLARDPRLALAVITLGAGLEDAGQRGRAGDVGQAADRLVGGRAEAGLAEERLLAQPMLGEVDRPHARPHRLQCFSQAAHGGLGHVLELVGDDVDLRPRSGRGRRCRRSAP